MVTLRELAAESFGRITRKALEPQLAQLTEAITGHERPVAVAPGRDQASGVAVAVTDQRLLISRGAPFAHPQLMAFALDEVAGAEAFADGEAWALRIECPHGPTTIHDMFDRDAQRIAALLV